MDSKYRKSINKANGYTGYQICIVLVLHLRVKVQSMSSVIVVHVCMCECWFLLETVVLSVQDTFYWFRELLCIGR